ncbi:ABC transporter permease [Actinoplanes palleronii]|uniref:ABC transporter permease n=1 Tax=Actinoplanes palleronii TaxID=113570 RepID=A0ABQ4BC91_9ACTN|nr:ABC transporter permease [Actinoplanes palleronii]
MRWPLITAFAPIAFGTTYFVTHRYLPADYPLYGAAIRALPAGLLLLLVRRRLPSGEWWWRSLVLGSLNMGAFFALIYLAAQLLPTSVASTIMATSPVGLMLMAWAALSERPQAAHLAGAGIGVAGVCLMLFTGPVAVDARGVLASVAAMTMSSLGYVLAKKWSAGLDVFSLTSWQLIAGGLILLPAAVLVEGAPPVLDAREAVAFTYVTVVATAVAFAAWFTGLRHLSAGTVGLIGLLNPVTGVLLGTAVSGETLGARQVCGLALVLAGVLLGQRRLDRKPAQRRRATGRGRRMEDQRHSLGTTGSRLPSPDPTGDHPRVPTLRHPSG